MMLPLAAMMTVLSSTKEQLPKRKFRRYRCSHSPRRRCHNGNSITAAANGKIRRLHHHQGALQNPNTKMPEEDVASATSS